MGQLIREHDWTSTPLGPPETWPQSLRSALSICLNSSFPTAIYWGPELRLLYNDAWAPIPAERHPWALGRPAAEVWHDIWEVVGPQFARVLETGEGISTYDQMLPMERGGIVQETYWNYSFTAIRGEDNRIAGIFNQGNETTQLVQARLNAAKEVSRLSRMFRQAPGATAILRGPDHVFEIANPAYLELIGREDILGKPVREALPEVVAQGFTELLDQVYSSGETHVGHAAPVALNRGGTIEERHVDFVFQPIFDEAGGRQGIFVQATDVTDTMHALTAARDSEHKYHAIVNSIEQMIWSTRPDGYHDYFNDRWYDFTGVPEGSTDGEAWKGMFHPDDQDRINAVWSDSLATGKSYHIEYRLRHHSGEYRWVIGRAQCVRDESGRIVRWYGTCTDIHALKMAEESRQLLLDELNHRVKNLFTLVSGIVSMTARKSETPAEMAAAVKGRVQALARAHDLIRFSAQGAITSGRVSLGDLADQILAPHLTEDLVGATLCEGPQIQLGERASTSMALILHELATNAAKYGALHQPGGRLSIRWTVSGPNLALTWAEECATPKTVEVSGSGFGSRLIRSTVEGQFMGQINFGSTASGILIQMELELDRLSA
ncbi:sensor histidine kinase [Mangrovicoccus algicola]|uniref:histidine kinase n=1 Tax=Mangrovicoccus algicola TaxID=2771008 RepID=A0A8J6YTM7_9RHOB|nr:PAS domain-containing protein [Mangrovicoccus algicola]MBE3637450.1 PAS domain-containing protein [Mangrovicoccus algicola]